LVCNWSFDLPITFLIRYKFLEYFSKVKFSLSILCGMKIQLTFTLKELTR
jgi:hypothetical protein